MPKIYETHIKVEGLYFSFYFGNSAFVTLPIQKLKEAGYCDEEIKTELIIKYQLKGREIVILQKA